MNGTKVASVELKLVDLNRQHDRLRDELMRAFDTVIQRGRFILGEEVTRFEKAFAQLHGCGYAVGVSNGTDAITLALKALNIGPGAEVIVPAMTFFATAEAVCNVGATPVLVDVENETLGLDPARAREAITAATRAIIPVHLHGWPVPLEPLLKLANEFELAIVEDCAQAHGASENGHPVGSRSDAGCFSCFPAKNLGALGDAGILITQSEAIADRVRALANHGRRQKHANTEVGFNNRLDELQAAILNVKLPRLMEWNERRRALARRYSEHLIETPLKVPNLSDERRVSSFHLYVVRCRDRAERDELAADLRGMGIETGMHYPTPLHLQPGLSHLGCTKGSFPVAEQAAETMLSLPLFPEMREDEQDCVVEGILKYFDVPKGSNTVVRPFAKTAGAAGC
ncbi:MAG TPA: DegT/DnrJ/EryC1/StrS family aminotransferase [Lacipirellulaceae bacterium]|nr:DegT/DnrJ/EryC1/StrS family aminotransferase [Lacipirellulaceae bacterium]